LQASIAAAPAPTFQATGVILPADPARHSRDTSWLLAAARDEMRRNASG